jgi:hypothetical protein
VPEKARTITKAGEEVVAEADEVVKDEVPVEEEVVVVVAEEGKEDEETTNRMNV